MLVAGQPMQIGSKGPGECPDSLVAPAYGLADPRRGGKDVAVMGIDVVVRADINHLGRTVGNFHEVIGNVRAKGSVEFKIESDRL